MTAATHSTFASARLLIVNKRRLPAILQNDVPPLRIAGTAVQSLVVTPNRLWGVLHPSVGKQIQHREQTVTILNVHENIRCLAPPASAPFWVPLRPTYRKEMRKERIRRQYKSGLRVAFSGLHYIGEARPVAESVSIEAIYREVPRETIQLLRWLGRPETRLLSVGSRMNQLMSVCSRSANLKLWLHQQLNKMKKDFMENLVVEHLRRSQMNDKHVAATYDVLVGGVALASVAKQRGLNKTNLRQIVNRITRQVRPSCEAQITAWAGEEEVQEAVSEVTVLENLKFDLTNLTPDELQTERIASIR